MHSRSAQCLVYEDAHFRAEHCVDCCVPGYLIFQPKDSAASISQLIPAALDALGPRLALLVGAIEAVVRPELVYCARFGEEVSAVHFHLFPRTAWLAAEYLRESSHNGKLNGPLLLNWARERYPYAAATAQAKAEVDEVIRALRNYVRTHNPSSSTELRQDADHR